MRKHLALFILIFVTGSLIGQETLDDIRIDYDNQDASLNQIFADLEEEYGIRFSYATQALGNQTMDVDFQEDKIEDVIEYLLADQNMEYKIVANNILVRKKEAYEVDANDAYHASLHLSGKVTTEQRSDALDYATISITNSSIGTYTDKNGRFDIEVPEELINENLVIQYIGYERVEYKISELADTYIITPMTLNNFAIEAITIVNKQKPIKIGNIDNNIVLNNGQITSGTSNVMGGDIARQIQLLPGITAHEDDSADIKIRGSNSEETLLILDGMPIYNANHYYGIFSGVNTAYIDSVNLFKNSYPIHYGGRTAGLVELFSDNDIPQKPYVSANLDLLTSSVIAKIPLSSNSTFSIAGRTTIKDIDNQQFNTKKSKREDRQRLENLNNKPKDQNSDPSSRFYDINSKFLWSTEKQKFQLNLFRSADQAQNRYLIEITDNQENGITLEAIDNQIWSTNASSMIYDLMINKNLTLRSRSFFSQYINDEENILKLNKKYTQTPLPPPNENPLFTELKSKQDNSLTDIGTDNFLQYQKGNHTYKIGVTATHHELEYGFKENKINKFGGMASFLELGGYLNYEFLLANKLKINTGLRAIHYTNLNQTMLAPRLNANLIISNNLSLKSSFGIEQQVIRQLNYEYRAQPMQLWISAGENDVPVLSSTNFMIGTTYKNAYFSLDVELYNKAKKGVLEFVVLTPSNPSNQGNMARDYELFKGDGFSRGIDIILSSGYKKYDTYLSYTLSKNEQQFKDIFHNALYPSENDRRHQLKWINSVTSGKFTYGMNAIFVSGLPYIDIRNIMLNGRITQTDPNLIRQRLRPYHRIDVSVAYDFKISKYNSKLTFSVFNLMDTQNVKYIHSVATELTPNQNNINVILGNETNLLNRTVNLGFNIEF